MTISTQTYQPPVIAPSLLKCDFGRLANEVERLETASANWMHWDVMDGHFVPNLSYGAMVIKSLRAKSKSFFDAHLMISDPEKYLDDYIKAGCDALTFHIEAVPEPTALLKRIRAAGKQAGLSLNPATPASAIEPFLGDCDLVLIMSVNPGFGGQAFMPEVLEKAKTLRSKMPPNALLSIDGGIGHDTITSAAQAGCQVFVAGSAIFDKPDYRVAIDDLKKLATV